MLFAALLNLIHALWAYQKNNIMYAFGMFDNEDFIPADTLGAGLVIDDDMDVNIVLLVGNDDEHASAVTMSIDTVNQLIESLKKMVSEALLVQEAIFTMPEESARQYLKNWAMRQQSEFN